MKKGGHFINGRWHEGQNPGAHTVSEASFSTPLYEASEATAGEIQLAVKSAKSAFDTWSRTPNEERALAIERIKEATVPRIAEIAKTWAVEAGMPIRDARAATEGLPISSMDSYARIAREFEYELLYGNSMLLHEPVGVAVGITPWNYPFSQVAIKAVTAIAAGCSIIVKPSELAPGCAYIFAEIVEAAGLPDGVFNLVSGSGKVGQALVEHPSTQVISFTGSTATGTKILQAAAAGIKRCTLELGGKSPLLILPGTDMEQAIANGMASCFRNNGQTCTALTRFLVPREDMSRAAEAAARIASSMIVGDPQDPATTLGPLVSRQQWERVQGFIANAIAEGTAVVTGGAGEPAGLEGGNYVRPTVFSNVAIDSALAQDEVFGPVLAVIPYDSVDQAVEIANNSPYGLAAAVWGPPVEETSQVARRISSGVISVNGASFNAEAPYGGLRRSGLGHELGEYGFREYLDVKVLNT